MSSGCVFCRILAGEIPSFKLCEDEHSYAFMDINPANQGHALVIPREHAADLHAVSEAALAATAITAKRVAAAVREVLDPPGINLVQCNGAAAGQSVLHFHMHVLPRRDGDDLMMNWGLVPGDMEAIGKLAARIREKL